ncbi:MAG: MaoC/PaaZ C-terminal domain-containing protein [Woeseiaceae bacterium]|nr:MaoC/PaaZ C-terminal domain-containing protein [Woeseiaceae bacterium]
MSEPTRYFEDLEIGEYAESSPQVVTEEEIVEFASRYDPQYFHMNPEAARSHPQFGEVVASGIHILAVWRQRDHEITGDIRWICGISWDDLRWNKPMRAGDAVRARAELLDKRVSASKPERGVVVYRYALVNQDDEELFYCTSTNYVERREPE